MIAWHVAMCTGADVIVVHYDIISQEMRGGKVFTVRNIRELLQRMLDLPNKPLVLVI